MSHILVIPPFLSKHAITHASTLNFADRASSPQCLSSLLLMNTHLFFLPTPTTRISAHCPTWQPWHSASAISSTKYYSWKQWYNAKHCFWEIWDVFRSKIETSSEPNTPPIQVYFNKISSFPSHFKVWMQCFKNQMPKHKYLIEANVWLVSDGDVFIVHPVIFLLSLLPLLLGLFLSLICRPFSLYRRPLNTLRKRKKNEKASVSTCR